MCVTPTDNASSSTTPKKLKFVINANDTPEGIKFIDPDDNGAEIRNKILNPEYIPLDLPKKKRARKKKSWIEKKQNRW